MEFFKTRAGRGDPDGLYCTWAGLIHLGERGSLRATIKKRLALPRKQLTSDRAKDQILSAATAGLRYHRRKESIDISESPHSLQPMDDDQDQLHQVLADYLEAEESGLAPVPAALLAGHPEVAEGLAEFMSVVEQLDHYFAGIRPPSFQSPSQTVSHSFEDYELIAELGRGGMGIVFKARQRSLNRLVALKVIRGGRADGAEDSRRFRAEAEAAAYLDHPHIVPIYEIGERNGRLFFSMKLLEGGSLAEKRGEFSENPRRSAELVEVIARAVHHAHQRGILHRDLKPSNILLDSEGRPHVADFGLAKWLHVDQTQTQTGAILGTPAYMSPEQTVTQTGVDERSSATTASDVYGLGAILYALLTGQAPFRGLLPLDTLLAVRDQEPQAPGKLNPRIDRDLETICLKCLEKDPGRRYPSALDLAEDLRRWQGGEAIRARPIGAWERGRRWCRRNPLLAAMTSAAALLVLFGVGALAVGYVLVSRAHERSEEYRRRAERQTAQLLQRHYTSQMGVGFRHLQRGELAETRKLLDEFLHQEDLKGFEWHRLKAQALAQPHEVIRYTGHKHIVYCSTFSPDGMTVATCGADRTIQLWDPTTGATRKTLRPTPGQGSGDENCVRFSPDGRRLASGCEDGTVRLWNLADDTWQALKPAHKGEVSAVSFSRDGRWLVTAGADGIARVWDLETPGSVIDFKGHVGPVTTAVFSPNGREIASTDKQGGLLVWDAKTQVVRFSATPGGALVCLAFSPDGSVLASGGQDGVMYLWRTHNNQFEQADLQKLAIGTIRSLNFSPDGRRLMCADSEGAIVVWRYPEGDVETHFNARQGQIWSARFAPDGRRLVTASQDRTARIWELSSASGSVRWIPGVRSTVRQLAFSPGGDVLAMSLEGGDLMISDPLKPGSVAKLPITAADLTPPAFSPDGSQLAAVGPTGRINRWNMRQQRELPPFDPPSVSTGSPGWKKYSIRLAYTAEDRLVALRCDGRLWICDGTNWREQSVPCRSNAEPPLLSPLIDRRTLLMCDEEESFVRFWSTEQQRAVREFSCPVEQVASCTADGERVAIGHKQGNISLVRLSSDPERIELISPGRALTSLAFSSDGKTLASASYDGSVRLWNATTGQEFFVLEDLHRRVRSIAFSNDGRFLATAGEPYINGYSVAIYDSRHSSKGEVKGIDDESQSTAQ